MINSIPAKPEVIKEKNTPSFHKDRLSTFAAKARLEKTSDVHFKIFLILMITSLASIYVGVSVEIFTQVNIMDIFTYFYGLVFLWIIFSFSYIAIRSRLLSARIEAQVETISARDRYEISMETS